MPLIPLEEWLMTRKWLLASLAGTAVLAGAAFVLLPSRSPAGPEKSGQDEPPSAKALQLPIGQVVLFSSGVGYFQREGTVEGNARIDLSFPVADINDLLKSMVLRDLDGGHIAAVSYDSNAPVERTLKSFAVNLASNPTFGQILNQARGEKVEVVLQQASATQPGTMTGTVVGIEPQHVPAGKDGAAVLEMLNLWCADGLRAVKLSELQRVRFLNPVLDSEFKKALETLAQAHDTQKKAVTLHFVGAGQRNVRVGYVVENPIWKTSYRLVLDKQGKPFLQGWAIVENPSDEDWKDVRLALISGRPISFQMDLYQPLFVPRPVVEPELFASLRPPTYSGDLLARGEKADKKAEALDEGPRSGLGRAGDKYAPAEKAPAKLGAPPRGGAARGNGGFGAGGAGTNLNLGDGVRKALDGEMHLAEGVASAASAARLGDFFRYVLDKPVSLPRQKSALLPIVNQDVEAERVSIYNERTQAKFPLLGLKFKNTSGLHLMQGPITVFEGASYAGDSRILDLQPKEERLLSYAVDLGTEVDPKPSADNGKLTKVKAAKGVLCTTTKLREAKTYTVKNRNDAERVVLVEHPVRNEFKLVDTEKPEETAADVYRFRLKVAPGKAETLTVTEERLLAEQVALTNFNDEQLRVFISSPASSLKVKKALEEAVRLREALAKTQREIQEQERQLKAITDDQVRLRANLKEMPATAAAYKRYLEKFDQQESQIEQLQADLKKLQATEHAQRKEFEAFLTNLDVE
jgi:hypothetical protein